MDIDELEQRIDSIDKRISALRADFKELTEG